jgi:hypothetical protein
VRAAGGYQDLTMVGSVQEHVPTRIRPCMN